jgi:hypothetical protein
MKTIIYNLKKIFTRAGEFITAGRIKNEDHKLEDIWFVVDDFMRKSKPFLLNEYSAYDLSRETRISMPDLTSLMAYHNRRDFKDFIDGYRIDYCKNVLIRFPPKILSLPDLTVICGFSDQRDLCSAFKRATGVGITKYVRKARREWVAEDFVDLADS